MDSGALCPGLAHFTDHWFRETLPKPNFTPIILIIGYTYRVRNNTPCALFLQSYRHCVIYHSFSVRAASCAECCRFVASCGIPAMRRRNTLLATNINFIGDAPELRPLPAHYVEELRQGELQEMCIYVPPRPMNTTDTEKGNILISVQIHFSDRSQFRRQ